MLEQFLVFLFCAVIIYISLNFRLYMIFHHPPKYLRKKIEENKKKRDEIKRKQEIMKGFK